MRQLPIIKQSMQLHCLSTLISTTDNARGRHSGAAIHGKRAHPNNMHIRRNHPHTLQRAFATYALLTPYIPNKYYSRATKHINHIDARGRLKLKTRTPHKQYYDHLHAIRKARVGHIRPYKSQVVNQNPPDASYTSSTTTQCARNNNIRNNKKRIRPTHLNNIIRA